MTAPKRPYIDIRKKTGWTEPLGIRANSRTQRPLQGLGPGGLARASPFFRYMSYMSAQGSKSPVEEDQHVEHAQCYRQKLLTLICTLQLIH